MVTMTWELHFTAPGSPEVREALLSDLDTKRSQFTVMRMDYLEDGDKISVMFEDIEVMSAVIQAQQYAPIESMTCQFGDGQIYGTLVLDNEESDLSQINFPDYLRSE